ncbi:hypothetical protein SAMN05421841_3548 [Chryseobacterium wanjuense]|uniref:Uncharacterized protein n=1 Tax=Chryseobacterium wanjuense TaxID=356305 RepID=A0A1I0S0G8_9FLAO|nr:hypothetical protein SAMN05421841_3548 [Chryseobacterium wanjuense]
MYNIKYQFVVQNYILSSIILKNACVIMPRHL